MYSITLMLQTRIIPSKPALILEGKKKNLIVTDIHLGFEECFESQMRFSLEKIQQLMKQFKNYLKLLIQRNPIR